MEKCGVNNIDELDKILHDPENEKNYWITRLGKQSAIDMLSYGKISSGNMDSITNMPSEDSRKSYRWCYCPSLLRKKWKMAYLHFPG